jgi:hypothetical protein
MLVAWTSAIRCLKEVSFTSSSTSRYRQNPFKDDELSLLESLGELREIPPDNYTMPFGAGFVLTLVVPPAFLGECDVENDILAVVFEWFWLLRSVRAGR